MKKKSEPTNKYRILRWIFWKRTSQINPYQKRKKFWLALDKKRIVITAILGVLLLNIRPSIFKYCNKLM